VPKSELLITLEAFLISQTSKGKRCLLIVDEAQNLTPRAVEELRMLSNFQFGNQALLQSFLVGQPEFREILQRPEMEQFRQRVAATCHIGPLDQDETKGYIEHRLKCAGATGKPSFEPEAFEAIFKASGGIPRRINSVCDRLLLLGFLAGRTHLTVEDVDRGGEGVRAESAGARARPDADRMPAVTRRAARRGGRCWTSTCPSCKLDGTKPTPCQADGVADGRPAWRPAAAAGAQPAAPGAHQRADPGHAAEAGQRRQTKPGDEGSK
jgi:hypothetical protein